MNASNLNAAAKPTAANASIISPHVAAARDCSVTSEGGGYEDDMIEVGVDFGIDFRSKASM